MMKNIILTVMLISLVAVGAYAQSEDDPIKEQTQTRLQTRQQGEINRHGGEFVGQGGPQGPMGSGPLDDFIKMTNGDIDCDFAGEMHQYGWGPGDGTHDGPFGPNDGTGFGPGGGDGAHGENAANGARGRARSGRR